MNDTIDFLAGNNVSYLSGKAIESVLKGELKEAQELLKKEQSRIDKLPKVPQVYDLPLAQAQPKKPCAELPDNAHVCESCVKKDYREELPFDYRATITDKGTCDSCHGTDLQLTSLLKVRADIEAQKPEKPEKLGSVFAPELK